MAVNGGGTVEQCLAALESMHSVIGAGRTSWIRNDMVTVSKQELEDKMNFLRGSLPEALEKAHEIVRAEADILSGAENEAAAKISEAKGEAESIVADAKAELASLQQQIEQAKAEALRIQEDTQMRAQATQQQAQDNATGIIAKAHEEAARIVNLGEQRAMELIKEEAVYQRAEVHANELVESAASEAEALRQKTFTYLDTVLGQIEEYAGNLMADIHDQRDSLNGQNR